jgi:hypothetical protein
MPKDDIPPPDTTQAKDSSPVTDAASSSGANVETMARISQDVSREREDRAKSDTRDDKEKGKQEREKLWDKDPKTGEFKALNVDPPPAQLYAAAQKRLMPEGPGSEQPNGAGKSPGGAQKAAVNAAIEGAVKAAAGGAPGEGTAQNFAAAAAEGAAIKAAEQPPATKDKAQPASDQAKDKTKEGDVPLDAASQQAKDKFLEQMKGRLNEGDYKELEKRLGEMDKRILNNKVEGRDGKVNQQQELKKTYDALSQLADGKAEGKDGLKHNGENIYNKDDVNKIITDTVSKLADPEHNFNQGMHNTCALQSIARQEAAISPSTYAQRQADIARTGQFQADGKTVKLDTASLRLDGEARNNGLWPKGDARGASGHNNDIAMAQLNLNQKYGSDSQGNGNRIYKQNPNATGHGDTGESVVDRATGKVVGDSPEISASGVSSTKQAAFGQRFGDDFGKATTFVNAAAFGQISNVSSFTNGADMKNQLKANEAKGWQYSTIGMHTGHWSGSEGQGGAGGWHAVSVSMAAGDKVNVINNWGGKFNFTDSNGKAQDADKVLGWMNDTQNTPGSGYKPGDHNFDPDSKSRVDQDKDKDKEKEPEKEKKEPDSKKPEEGKKKFEKKDVLDSGQAQQLLSALAEAAQVQSQLDQLPQGDARRSQLQADKVMAERSAVTASGSLTRTVEIDA